MRSTILVAAALAFASLALGGCTADAQEPGNGESNITSGQGSTPIAETQLRDGVTKAPSAIAFDDNTRDIATKDGAERFDGKRRDGVINTGAKAADSKRDVITGGGAGSDGLADARRDVSGNGGPAAGLADDLRDNVEQPVNDMFEVALDDAVQGSANNDNIRNKARAAK